MKTRSKRALSGIAVFVAALSAAVSAQAVIIGEEGDTFSLVAQDGYISTPEASSVYVWGYGVEGNGMQYPGPTLIVDQDDVVTVTLTNELTVPTSVVFPGQDGVSTSGGSAGLLTAEAAPSGGVVEYTFTASHPGTYLYHSGTQMEVQVDMGLFGALIVRPAAVGQAYDHVDSAYDREYLFLMSEMDPRIHWRAEAGMLDEWDDNIWWPVYWFINGRAAPDTMSANFASWLPTQPYNCLPRMHPGERILLRFISAGRDLHPFHTHGNNFNVIAQDGRLLQSGPGMGADLAYSDFTITVAPGGTADAIFEWTGEKLGWDIYGHAPEDPMEPNEYAPDHGKPLPVDLPDTKDITPGAFWSGSPFLGAMGALPPGQGALNLYGGFFYMWHSHKEKEMVNFDVFPGGLMTMLIVEHPSAPIP